MSTNPARPAALDATACRFVLVEDNAMLRSALRGLLAEHFHPRALADFGDGTTALKHCLNEPPELLLTDLRLPDIDGRDLIRRLRARGATTRALVLTSFTDAGLPAELVALGVAGFVDKDSPPQLVASAVTRVLAGGMFFTAGVAPEAPLASALRERHAPPPSLLTERELKLVRLVAAGHSSKEIATQLDLSARTIEKWRPQVLEKLNLPDTASLVRWCVRNGLA